MSTKLPLLLILPVSPSHSSCRCHIAVERDHCLSSSAGRCPSNVMHTLRQRMIYIFILLLSYVKRQISNSKTFVSFYDSTQCRHVLRFYMRISKCWLLCRCREQIASQQFANYNVVL